jgi:hypothetical protein
MPRPNTSHDRRTTSLKVETISIGKVNWSRMVFSGAMDRSLPAGPGPHEEIAED